MKKNSVPFQTMSLRGGLGVGAGGGGGGGWVLRVVTRSVGVGVWTTGGCSVNDGPPGTMLSGQSRLAEVHLLLNRPCWNDRVVSSAESVTDLEKPEILLYDDTIW